jgi:hypothetical protein
MSIFAGNTPYVQHTTPDKTPAQRPAVLSTIQRTKAANCGRVVMFEQVFGAVHQALKTPKYITFSN